MLLLPQPHLLWSRSLSCSSCTRWRPLALGLHLLSTNSWVRCWSVDPALSSSPDEAMTDLLSTGKVAMAYPKGGSIPSKASGSAPGVWEDCRREVGMLPVPAEMCTPGLYAD